MTIINGEKYNIKNWFLLLAFVLYIGIVYLTKSSIYTFEKSSVSKIVVLLFAGVYTLALFGYIQLFNPFCSEGYKYDYQNCDGRTGGCSGEDQVWAITIQKMFRGPYMSQGNTQRGRVCREFARTQEGRNEIGRYECEVGYNGMPGKRFEFTPISNSKYKNERCMPKNRSFACDVDNNGIF